MGYSALGNSPGRQVLYESLGLAPEQVYAATQVHSREVLLIDRECPNTRPEADGMISRDAALWLSVTVADCLPVYLYDTESGGFGMLHSGWKGTGIVMTALRLMAEHWSTQAQRVAAVLGPCIRSCCYQVDAERAQAFEAEFGGSGGTYPLGPVVRQVPGADRDSWYIDLQAANARLLVQAGVRNIAVCGDCTFTDERLGSFRREGPSSYTLMAALVGYGESKEYRRKEESS
jgi:YfiH family protein